MSKEFVTTENAPSAIGPYSQAVKAGGFLFVSGQVALVPRDTSKKLNNPDIKTETRQVLNNLKGVVEAAGTSLESAVKMTVFMSDMNNYGAINEVYGEFFKDSKPARAAVEVSALPLGAGVEIEGIFKLE